MIFLVVLLLAFVAFAAPLGFAIDIKDGLKASKKPVPQRSYKDHSAIYDMKAAIISIIGAIIFVIWAMSQQ